MSEEMTFWDHLDVLRAALIRVIAVLLVILVGAFIALPHIFDNFILGPTRGDFFVYRMMGFLGQSAEGFKVDIININVATQFLTHISVAFWLALLVTFPYLVWEIWKFVSPALYPSEKKGVAKAFAGGGVLFYMGCATGYCVVFPLAFRFLSQYQVAESIVNQISLNSYLGNFITIVFMMGIVFELPVLAWMLSVFGLIDRGILRKYRRHAIVILLLLAAFITPTGDPFTLAVVFLPLYLLYELSILVVKPVSH